MTGRAPIGPRVTVALPPDLAAAVRHAAKQAKVSAAEIHRRALAEYLKEKTWRDRALSAEADADRLSHAYSRDIQYAERVYGPQEWFGVHGPQDVFKLHLEAVIAR